MPDRPFPASKLPSLQTDIRSYITSQDIIALKKLLDQWPALQFRRIIEMNSKGSFLLVSSETGRRPFLATNLFPRSLDQSVHLTAGKPDRGLIDAFVASKVAWLVVGVER